MTSVQSDLLTPAEYLEIERQSEIKHEYINGKMYAMSPGVSDEHDHIVTNVMRLLLNQTHGRSCRIFTADMRVKVSPTGLYTYPDVSALCGEPRFEDSAVDTLINPSIIIEVLSPSTELYDRGEKFDHYRSIDSLREYLLVAQSSMRVDHFELKTGQWIFSAATTPEDRVALPSIGCEISLADVYADVKFPPKETLGWPYSRRPASR
jgi:Uma2 family endonuclease